VSASKAAREDRRIFGGERFDGGLRAGLDTTLKKNAEVDVMNHSTGQHGFDFRDDDARTRDILARTVELPKSEGGLVRTINHDRGSGPTGV